MSDQHNRGGLLAFGFSMTFVLCFIIYLIFINDGVINDEHVIDPKTLPAGAVSFDMAKVAEPWVSTPEVVTYGQKVFKSQCASCHGAEGKADGAAAASLNPKPRNLVEGKWTKGEGIISHFNVVANGSPGTGMAPFGAILKASDRWAVLHFIETITQNKSKDAADKIAEFAKTAK